MKKKRSGGMIILGILLTSIGGLFFYWFSFPFIRCLISERFNLARFMNLGPAGRMSDFEQLLLVIMPIILMIAGIGILLLKSWARKTILFIFVPLVYLYSFVFAYVYIKGEGVANFDSFFRFCGIAILSSTLITGPVVIFFTRPKVKEQFKKETLLNNLSTK